MKIGKKKIVCLLLTALLAFTMFGCSAPEAAPEFAKTPPWSSPTNYEKSTYTVKKVLREQSGKTTVDGECITTDASTYTTTLKIDPSTKNITVESKLTITYTNSENAVEKDFTTGETIINKNCTDEVIAKVSFSSSMVPLKSEKSIVMDTRPEGSFQPHGYSAISDYQNGKVSVTFYNRDTKNDETAEYTMGSENKYDNEQLMYVARALQAASDTSTTTFPLLNAYDIKLNNKYFRHKISFAAQDSAPLALAPSFTEDRFVITDTGKKEDTGDGNIVKPSDGIYTVDTMQTTLVLTDTKESGPSITYLMSKPSIQFAERLAAGATPIGNAGKLILKMTYVEYELGGANEKYNTVYSLKDYTLNAGR